MLSLGTFTKDELSLLERQSTENMLIYYEEEMKRIAEGESPSSFLTKPTISRFMKLGVLELTMKGPHKKITLSRKGRELYDLPCER